MNANQLDVYQGMVGQAREFGLQRGVEVLCGIEAEIFPEASCLREMDRILESRGFDFVLGSLHHQLPAYRQWLRDHDFRSDREIIETYFAHLTVGAMTGRYHSIAHADVIRLYGTIQRFEPAEHEASIRRFLQAVASSSVCLEVNTSGLLKSEAVHPHPRILGWAAECGVNLTLGSDAHHPSQVGQYYEEVIPFLRELGFGSVNFFRQGVRVSVPL